MADGTLHRLHVGVGHAPDLECVGAPFDVARLGGCPHQAAWDKSRRRIAAILVSVFFHLTGDEMERAESSVEGDICKLVDWLIGFFF